MSETNNNNLNRIESPALNQGLGGNIKNTFENIDANFGVLSNRDFVKGDEGEGLITKEVLCSVLFRDPAANISDPIYIYTDEDGKDYIVYGYKQEIIDAFTKLRRELSGDNSYVPDPYNSNDDVMSAYNTLVDSSNHFSAVICFNKPIDPDNNEIIIKSIIPFIFIDQRFRTGGIRLTADNYDLSCTINFSNLSSENNSESSTPFKCIQNFPSLYYKTEDNSDNSNNLFWVINGTRTNIPARGPAGIDGEAGELFVGLTNKPISEWPTDNNEKTFVITKIFNNKYTGDGHPWQPAVDFAGNKITNGAKFDASPILIMPDYSQYSNTDDQERLRRTYWISNVYYTEGDGVTATVTWNNEIYSTMNAYTFKSVMINNVCVDPGSGNNNEYIRGYTIRDVANAPNTSSGYVIRGTSTTSDSTEKKSFNIERVNNVEPGTGPYQTIDNDIYTFKLGGKVSVQEGSSNVASGENSHAEGYQTRAGGDCSHAEGMETEAGGDYSHAEGSGSIAGGNYSHAEGINTVVDGDYSHAEGSDTTVEGNCSHTEGEGTSARGDRSHAEGWNTLAGGDCSHAEGQHTFANGENSHTEGFGTTADGNCSHAEGSDTVAGGDYSHAEGRYTSTSDDGSHAEGYGKNGSYKIIASGTGSHAEGYVSGSSSIQASGNGAHAEGINTTASGNGSHAEGFQTKTSGSGAHYAHAEGSNTIASGQSAHAEGAGTTASGSGSHAEGINTTASGSGSHAGGYVNTSGSISASGNGAYARGYVSGSQASISASGTGSHAEGYAIGLNAKMYASGSGAHVEGVLIGSSTPGYSINMYADGEGAHAEGCNTQAYGKGSHAEGWGTIASGSAAHAEGRATIASGEGSHAEGLQTQAMREYSHAEGYDTKAEGYASHAEGTSSYAKGTGAHAEGVSSFLNEDNIPKHNDESLVVTSSSYTAYKIGNNFIPAGPGTWSKMDKRICIGPRSTDSNYLSIRIPQQIPSDPSNPNFQAYIEKLQLDAYVTIDFAIFKCKDGSGDHYIKDLDSYSYPYVTAQVTGKITDRKSISWYDEQGNTHDAIEYITNISYNTQNIQVPGLSGYSYNLNSDYINLCAIKIETDHSGALGEYSHVEGLGCRAEANYTHAEGLYTEAINAGEHACGIMNESGYMVLVSGDIYKVERESTYGNQRRIIFSVGAGVSSGNEGYADVNPFRCNGLIVDDQGGVYVYQSGSGATGNARYRKI